MVVRHVGGKSPDVLRLSGLRVAEKESPERCPGYLLFAIPHKSEWQFFDYLLNVNSHVFFNFINILVCKPEKKPSINKIQFFLRLIIVNNDRLDVLFYLKGGYGV